MRVRTKKKRKDILLPEPDFIRKPPVGTSKPAIWGSQYREDHPKQAYFLALLGLTLSQMAQVMGVDQSTITKWQNKHPEFAEAVVKGREEADSKVAHSLYQAAVGYEHPDQVVLTNRVRKYDPETGKVVKEWTEPLIVDVTKRYPPNVTAAIKWLKARRPDVWGNKLEVKGKITMHHQIDLSKFSNKELEVLNKLSIQQQAEDADYEEMNGDSK